MRRFRVAEDFSFYRIDLDIVIQMQGTVDFLINVRLCMAFMLGLESSFGAIAAEKHH